MCISGGGGGAVSGGRYLADITREIPGLRDFPSPAWRRMSCRGTGNGDLVATALVALGGANWELGTGNLERRGRVLKMALLGRSLVGMRLRL